jgi:hypothetical protein
LHHIEIVFVGSCHELDSSFFPRFFKQIFLYPIIGTAGKLIPKTFKIDLSFITHLFHIIGEGYKRRQVMHKRLFLYYFLLFVPTVLNSQWVQSNLGLPTSWSNGWALDAYNDTTVVVSVNVGAFTPG